MKPKMIEKESDRIAMRPLGWDQVDIEIDFEELYRPVLVSQILNCCTILENGDLPDPEVLWGLTVSQRIECLFEIATHGGLENLELQMRCQQEGCEELIEIQISQEDIRKISPLQDPGKPIPIRIKGKIFNFRRPTGRDQLAWISQSAAGDVVTLKTMLDQLLVKKRSPISELDAKSLFSKKNIEKIDRKMRENDPLVDFDLTVLCPVCQRECSYFLDLEQMLLEHLHKDQLELLFEIHLLASAYHWTEQQIMSLGPIRRKRYLSFIEDVMTP